MINKDIEKDFKEYIENIFINDKMHLTLFGAIVIFIYSITLPFYILFLKVKNIFIKKGF